MLRAYNWSFAITRVKLAQLSDAPVFEYDFAYQLPSDWLKTLKVNNNPAGAGIVEYRIEGREILSNASDIYLRYISRVTDPNTMTADFREALAWRMAVDLAQSVTQSTTVQEAMKKGLADKITSADAQDAIEDFPPERPESDWVSVRA